MSTPNNTNFSANSSQSALERRRASSDNTAAPWRIVQLKRDNSMEQEHEVESITQTTIPTPQIPHKHTLGVRESSKKSQEQEQGEQDAITVVPRVLLPRKKPTPNLAVNSPRNPDHIILGNEIKCQDLFHQMRNSEVNLQDIQTLEIHLDTSKLSDYAEYSLALVFTELNPRSDGTNPHNLQTIRLVVKGNILLTRYSYHLVSPVLSTFVGDNLEKLVKGRLSEKEKRKLPCKINSTERVLAKALLGIRGVKQISIEGKGNVEADFAGTIKATVTQSLGTDIVEKTDPDSGFSTHRFNKLGTICSDAYAAKAHRPYPTVPGALDYDFSHLPAKKRFLVNEKVEIAANSSGLDNHGMQAAAAAVKQHGTRSSTRGMTVKKQEHNQAEEDDDIDKSDTGEDDLELRDMVRINKKKAVPGDIGSETLNTEVMPVVLTAREETVELGWKV